jgi:antitoxin Phd
MTVFTYSKARQNFSFLLNAASSEGEVLIKRRDGTVFTVRPLLVKSSPLDVASIRSKVTTAQIVEAVRESRIPRQARNL